MTEPEGEHPPDDQRPAEGHDPDEAYLHDPAIAAMAARLADAAFEAAPRSWDVNECTRALAAQEGLDPDGLLGRELLQAARYRLRLDYGERLAATCGRVPILSITHGGRGAVRWSLTS